MKKNLLMLLLGGAMLMPANVMAQSEGGGDDNPMPEIWRGPVHNPYAYITFEETTEIAYVCFNSAVSDAEVIIYLNDVEVSSQTINATAGTQVPIYLPAYGNGEFTIQVKSGSNLLATYSVTL